MDAEKELLKINLQVFKLKLGASFQDVQQAYRSAMKMWHPDKHMGSDEGRRIAGELAKQLNAAYEWLQENQSLLEACCQQQQHALRNCCEVDKFLFGDGWCEEADIDSPSDNVAGVSPKVAVRIADSINSRQLLEDVSWLRNYNYIWCDKLSGLHGQPIRSRVDFSRRSVAINMSL